VSSAIPGEPNDTTGPIVVITVHDRVYQLDGTVFAQWRVREVAADIAASAGEPYKDVVTDVINAYVRALDGTADEAAA
jgi:hypothetical protein